MKITHKVLQVTIEHEVAVGSNNAIEATIQHMAWIHTDEETGNVSVDLDFADVDNVRFLGIPIEKGYKAFQKFKSQMLELGIDVDALLTEKAANLIDDMDMAKLKSLIRR